MCSMITLLTHCGLIKCGTSVIQSLISLWFYSRVVGRVSCNHTPNYGFIEMEQECPTIRYVTVGL